MEGEEMKRIAYLSLVGSGNRFNKTAEENFNQDVYILQETIPDIPYLKIEIKVIKKETRYNNDRKKKWHLLNKKEKK